MSKEQKQKGRNEAWHKADAERRRSNVAVPHKNRAKYDRRRKHKGKGWD